MAEGRDGGRGTLGALVGQRRGGQQAVGLQGHPENLAENRGNLGF